MKNILFTGGLIALFAYAYTGNSTSTPTQSFCPPKYFVVNLNIPPEAYRDKNFDESDDKELALLMFPPEYVAESIPNYHQYILFFRDSKLRQPLHVYVKLSSENSWSIDANRAHNILSGQSLYTDSDETEHGWQISLLQGEEFSPWGICFDYSNNNLSCHRDLKVGDLWLKYFVKAENIALYPEIDAFLTKHITAWQCDSEEQSQ